MFLVSYFSDGTDLVELRRRWLSSVVIYKCCYQYEICNVGWTQ